MPLPPKRTGRIRRTLTSLILLSVLSYAGGVYYALDNDNFHDFFTEYVPFGEDAVAYFEERNFRNRFPSRPAAPKSQEQIRGERKITIGKSSGVSAHIAEPTTSDLGQRGRHVSALDDNKASASEAQQQPSVASGREKTMAVEKAKDSAKGASSKSELNKSDVSKSKSEVKQSKPAKSTPSHTAEPTAPTETMSLVDHISVPDATEPLVQKAVKMVNDIITVVNSDPNATKYQTTLAQAKSQLLDVVAGISQLKSNISSEADMKVSNAHSEFDTAAKELVSRLEKEMQSQELRWREEYESERERLAQSYQDKLAAELDVVRKVAESRTDTTIVEQEIALRRQFAKQIQDRIENERNGRLARLEDLSASVAELQALSSQWNNVVETVTQTQHLHVALDAVRASIAKSDYPTPFLDELLALKEVSGDNKVVAAAVNSIPRAAYQDGVPSTAYLVDRYRRVASEVRKAALLPADAGVASHAASAVLSKFMFSKKDAAGLPAGDDVEAVLTRTEVLLEEGNLDAAVREMNGLRGWAGLLSKDWVAECRRVLETRQATDVSSFFPVSWVRLLAGHAYEAMHS